MTRTGALETQLSMDAAMERAEDWGAKALDYIRSAAPGSWLGADDLRNVIGDPPAHGDAMGTVFRIARNAKLIHAIGYEPSTRPERHGAVNRIWERT